MDKPTRRRPLSSQEKLSKQPEPALNEVNLFLRGLVRLLGFKSEIVEHDRAEQFAGESKYPLRKMLSFAWQGITSFSTAPLRLITATGVVVSIISIAMSLWGLGISLLTDKALPRWAPTFIPMYFLGGVQLLSVGVIGEYVAKMCLESKKRQRFHVDVLKGAAFAMNSVEIGNLASSRTAISSVLSNE